MLPRVKREIISSTTYSMGKGNLSFVKNKMVQIKNENPVLFLILQNVAAREDWSEKEKNCYILGALQFYMLLSMQDECDELQKHNPI